MNNLPYGTLRAFLTPFLILAFRPKVKGLRNVPATGPVIIASNHLSFSDSIFMPLVVPRKVTFLAKSEYFTSPGPKGFIKKLTFIALGQVPVDRSGGRRSEAALITGLQVLAAGDCLGIESGAPIIPVAMFNTDKIQPTGTVVPKVKRVGMTFGEAMYFDGDPKDPVHLRACADQIMKRIQEMSGQEYVDDYAPKKAALDPNED
jgi:1-acyl-sn-glycerol-3-phosphate acyltransferase